MASARGARLASIFGTQKLNENRDQVFGELSQGYDASQGYLNDAKGIYGDVQSLGQEGLDRYKGLTFGTGEDIQRTLEGTGGYQFNRDQGLQALTRARSAQGMLASGNTDTDAIKFASGLASNTLAQERAAYSPFFSLYSQGAQGQAQTLGNQANLATDYFGNRASVTDNTNKEAIGLTVGALKAGDQARAQNESNRLAAAQAGVRLATSFLGGGF